MKMKIDKEAMKKEARKLALKCADGRYTIETDEEEETARYGISQGWFNLGVDKDHTTTIALFKKGRVELL